MARDFRFGLQIRRIVLGSRNLNRFARDIQTRGLQRIHSECMTGDVFGSARCDCGAQLDQALSHFKQEGGVLLYLRQEGRGIGLVEKLRAYNLQDEGMNTYEANEARGHQADGRDYGVAVSILQQLGVRCVELLTNNPEKVDAHRHPLPFQRLQSTVQHHMGKAIPLLPKGRNGVFPPL